MSSFQTSACSPDRYRSTSAIGETIAARGAPLIDRLSRAG
jgi:hypothetical protein